MRILNPQGLLKRPVARIATEVRRVRPGEKDNSGS
jgi:hypothetical protein